MKIENLGNHQTVITVKGGEVFFLYNTPVAAWIDGKFYRTEQYYSVTTSKHINQWLDGRTAEKRPQSFFDELA